VGRHAAPDGASAHPLVAAALAQRAGGEPAPEPDDPPGDLGGLGWPDPPSPGDGGLGWPAKDADEAPTAAPEERAPAERPPVDHGPEETATAARRRGWRRLFGPSAA
jgi:hypothetical protein